MMSHLGQQTQEEVAHPDEVGEPPTPEEPPGLKKKLTRLLIEGLIFSAILFAIMTWQSRHLIDEGEAAPAFSLQTLSGDTVTLAAQRGKPVLLVFWAPWCSVCKLTTGQVSEVQAAYGDDVSVLSIALSYETPEELRDFVTDKGIDYPVLLGDKAIAEAYRVTSFPTFYIIDREGQIDHHTVGYTTELGLRARLW